MNDGPHPTPGRLGWLFAALLFGILAGGGIAWALISHRAESAPVVAYQMPTPTASASLDDSAERAGLALRRHRHTVHPGEDLPSILVGAQASTAASPTPAPDLAAGLDGSTATEPPAATISPEQTPAPRQTLLVDGIAITQPPASSAPPMPLPRPANRVVYDLNSTGVDDSITLAVEGIQSYLKGKGFTLREDTWGGELSAGRAKAVSHQLFKGNDYWFCMGSAATGSTVRVRLYDNEGNAVDTNYWQHEQSDGSYAAAELLCQHTGTYFVVVFAEKMPEERIPWGVVFAYR